MAKKTSIAQESDVLYAVKENKAVLTFLMTRGLFSKVESRPEFTSITEIMRMKKKF